MVPVTPIPQKVQADKARHDYAPLLNPPADLVRMTPSFLQTSSNTYCLCPLLPLGGHLSHFMDFWRTVTTDSWVLSIVAYGFFSCHFLRLFSWTRAYVLLLFA